MADTKISALSATTVLDAADEFPLNDSGTTKKITAANLAAQLAGMLPQDAGGGGSATNMTQGATGATGPAGGATGATGSSGVTGPAGLDGIDGAQGPPGNPGATGATGAGVTGATGVAGPTGAQGLDGLEGPRGVTGPPGLDGLDGPRGLVGATGFTGPAGLDGVDGTRGATGAGTTGATGPVGPDGLDGSPGSTGATGAGATGATGAVGASGSPGGATGATGAAGTTGATGPSGLDGVDGSPGRNGMFNAYALLRDEQTSGTAGGGATSGSFLTRVLNTEVFDTAGFVGALSSSQFALDAGTYYFEGQAPFRQVGACKLKLRNITDSTDALIGASGFADTTANMPATHAFIKGRVTIASTKTFELQYRVGSTKATDGLGVADSFSVAEIYAELQIWREA